MCLEKFSYSYRKVKEKIKNSPQKGNCDFAEKVHEKRSALFLVVYFS